MHILGFEGMPRRVYTYPDNMGWGTWNLVSSVGAVLLVLGGVLFVYNVVRSYRWGVVAGEDPWRADTLEWSVSSPPPVYNFLYVPIVEGRSAIWDRTPDAPVVTGLRSDVREVLITDVMDAEPVTVAEYPQPSIWPFVCAVVTSAFFVGSIFTPWALPAAIVPLAVTLIGWFWPKKRDQQRMKEEQAEEGRTPPRPLTSMREVRA
jgi:cytochrome c oxidase subunit 1